MFKLAKTIIVDNKNSNQHVVDAIVGLGLGGVAGAVARAARAPQAREAGQGRGGEGQEEGLARGRAAGSPDPHGEPPRRGVARRLRMTQGHSAARSVSSTGSTSSG